MVVLCSRLTGIYLEEFQASVLGFFFLGVGVVLDTPISKKLPCLTTIAELVKHRSEWLL